PRGLSHFLRLDKAVLLPVEAAGQEAVEDSRQLSQQLLLKSSVGRERLDDRRHNVGGLEEIHLKGDALHPRPHAGVHAPDTCLVIAQQPYLVRRLILPKVLTHPPSFASIATR